MLGRSERQLPREVERLRRVAALGIARRNRFFDGSAPYIRLKEGAQSKFTADPAASHYPPPDLGQTHAALQEVRGDVASPEVGVGQQ